MIARIPVTIATRLAGAGTMALVAGIEGRQAA